MDQEQPTETGTGPLARILLVEDDVDIAAEILIELEAHRFEIITVGDGRSGLQAVRDDAAIELVIADRMLPELDGLAMVEAMRRDGIRTPVLVLSALGSVDDRVRGLKAGGDDYLPKPFEMIELAARVEALLRRPDARLSVIKVGTLQMDLIERTVARGGRSIDLLPREFKLLEYMMRRPNQVVTRAMLLEDVWNYRFVPETNLVDVHMGKLRHKVDVGDEAPMIVSVRGSGFKLCARN